MKDQFDDLTGAVQWRWITLGFLTSSLGLALLFADSVLEIGYILSFDAQIRKLLVHPAWRLGVGGAITALTFLGSWLLWRRLPDEGWLASSTMLVLMNITHVGLWLLDHHGELGLPDQRFEQRWLRLQLSQVLNWTEFIAWVGLLRVFNSRAFDGPADAVVEAWRTRPYPGFAWLGLAVSLGIAALLTDWAGGWPLERVAWLTPLGSMMLATASSMLTLTASFQIMLYCYRSARLSHRLWMTQPPPGEDGHNWYQDTWDDDPWGNRRA
jgi:hypothetical protein